MTRKSCVAIGFAMAAAILLLGPYTNYSLSAVDMWFSTGYFTNFADLADRFGLHYYQASRLPYILPGAAVYAIFTPKVANFLLNLASFGTSLSALLVFTSRTLDRRWSIALTCLFAFNSYLLCANLWDYSDGPAIAYFLAGLAVAAWAASDVGYTWRTLLIVAACWTCTVLTNVVSVILILPFGVYVLFMPRCAWQASIRRAALMAVGVLLVFVPLLFVSRYVYGLWFFPAPQIEEVLHTAQDPDFLLQLWGPGYGWLTGAYRLAALYGPLLVATLCLFDRRFRTPAFVSTFAVCAAGGLLYLAAELGGKVMLRSPYHGSFLLIFSFIQTVALVRAAIGEEASAEDRSFAPKLLIGLSIAVSLAFAGIHDLNVATWPVLCLCVAAMAGAILIRRRFPRRMTVLAVTMTLMLNVSTASDGQIRWIYGDFKGLYDATMQAQAVLGTGMLRGRKIRFWHDGEDPQAPLFLAIDALYLWDYVDLTNKISTMNQGELGRFLPPGVSVVNLCTDACPLETRRQLLNQVGLEVLATYSWKVVPREGRPFMIAIQQTGAMPTRSPSAGSQLPR